MINWRRIKNNIPSNFKIKGKIWEVLWVDAFIDDHIGETRFDKRQIVIKNNLSPKLTVYTFTHEIWHMISDETDANLTEKQVLALEKATPYLLEIFKGLNS